MRTPRQCAGVRCSGNNIAAALSAVLRTLCGSELFQPLRLKYFWPGAGLPLLLIPWLRRLISAPSTERKISRESAHSHSLARRLIKFLVSSARTAELGTDWSRVYYAPRDCGTCFEWEFSKIDAQISLLFKLGSRCACLRVALSLSVHNRVKKSSCRNGLYLRL